MKISAVSNFISSPNNVLNTNNKKDGLKFNYNKNNTQIPFKAAGSSVMGFIWAKKLGTILIKEYKLQVIKKEIKQIFRNPKENLAGIVRALRNLSIIQAGKGPDLNSLELSALGMFKYLDDFNGEHRTAKKDYINSLANQNKISNDSFVSAFKNLDDDTYKNFKTDLLEKFMYSKNFEASRTKDPAFLLSSLKLMGTLPTLKYQDFLQKNIEGIKKLDSSIIKAAIKEFNTKKNLAYLYYINDFSSEKSSFKDSAWKNHFKRAFLLTLNSNLKNPEKVAEYLNMDATLTNEVFLDYKALTESQKTDVKSLSTSILSDRLHEKINNFENNVEPKLIEILGTSLNSKLKIANLRLKELNNYIDKTEHADELKKMFQKDLYKIKSVISNLEEEIRLDNEIPIDCSGGRC